MPKPALCVILGDTHFGGFTALFPPRFITQAGNKIAPNPLQRWLYQNWIADWKDIRVKAQGKRLIVVHCGDVVEGEHHDIPARLPDLADQEALAVDMLTPICSWAEKVYLLKGTEAHAGEQHQSERRIAKELGAALSFRLRLDVDGCLIDVAHHSSGNPKTIGLQVIQDCLTTKEPIPRYVFRAHRHRIVDTGDEWPFMRVLTIPSWQLRTSYGWKICTNVRAPVGMILLEGGKVEIIRHEPAADPIRKV